jgi:nitroreductase
MELTFTMRPRARRSAGRNAWVTAACPIRLISSCCRSRSIGSRDLIRVRHIDARGAQAAALEPFGVLVLAHGGYRAEPELAQVHDGGLANAGRGARHEDCSGGHCGGTYPLASPAVDVDDAIRTRRTHKVYGDDPVPRETLDELFELARWAPNHNLTNPWRFRVLGPDSLARVKDAAGEEAAAKLDRAPTLVVASVVENDDPVQDEEDHAAAAVAAYIVLLGAHARGLAGYWRTPAVLRTPEGRSAAGIPAGERVIGLLHLGPRRQEKEPPERLPPGEFVTYLP